MKTIEITLTLDAKAVKHIEKYLEDDTLQSYLESEINDNPEAFVELLGLDNY